MSWGVNQMGNMKIYNPAIERALAEIPRPNIAKAGQVTPEQEDLAEKVVTALLEKGFIQGPGGDVGPGWKECKVREFLWTFVLSNTDKAIKSETEVDEIACNLGVYTKVDEVSIRKFVTFCGFSPEEKVYKKPQRPKGATREMIEVAEAVVNALYDGGFRSGWGGDKSPALRAEGVYNELCDMINGFKNLNYLSSDVANLGDGSLERKVINAYARFFGYSVDWNPHRDGGFYARLGNPIKKE